MSQLKKGAILSYINIALTNLIGLLLTPFIIKSLGESEYGLYTLIGSLVAYFSLMDLGLNNTIVRFVAKYRTEKDVVGEKKFLGSIFIIYFFISVIVLLFGLFLYLNLEHIFKGLNTTELAKAKIMFLILIFNIAITLPGGSFTAICNAYEQFVFPRFITIIRYVLRTILIYFVLFYGGKAISIVVIDTILNVLLIVAVLLFVVKKVKLQLVFKGIEFSLFKSIFKYSIWIFLMAMIGQFFWNTGQIVLGLRTNTLLIAIYGLGITLGGYYGGFAGAINTVFLPKATKMVLLNTNEDLLNEMIKISRLLLIILTYILFAFLLFGQEFIVLWVGHEYIDSWFVAATIMIVYSIPLLQNFAHSIIEAKNKVFYKVIIYMVFISLGVLLGYLLIDGYGVKGMALGIALGWLIAQFILNIVFHKVLGLNILLFLKEVFISKLFLLICIAFSSSFLIKAINEGTWFLFGLKIVLFTILYFLCISFGLNTYERNLLKEILKIKDKR
ncbi:oligosaccharide flippase family protein [Flavobacterium sp. J27]|uniref:oligosaccharide flippase family protein n=1 Tax=Flavobacterium sp. J27 TaxID=2060419 RepID=UPI0010317066|nr:oligosaccharide flippase family protein [Flavobacterium sp. J27]